MSDKKKTELVFSAFLLYVQRQNDSEDKQASSLVVFLDKDLNGIVSTFEWLDW